MHEGAHTTYEARYSVHDAHEDDPRVDDDDVELRHEALTSDEEVLLADVVVHALRVKCAAMAMKRCSPSLKEFALKASENVGPLQVS